MGKKDVSRSGNIDPQDLENIIRRVLDDYGRSRDYIMFRTGEKDKNPADCEYPVLVKIISGYDIPMHDAREIVLRMMQELQKEQGRRRMISRMIEAGHSIVSAKAYVDKHYPPGYFS